MQNISRCSFYKITNLPDALCFPDALNAALSAFSLRLPGVQEISTAGFVAPHGKELVLPSTVVAYGAGLNAYTLCLEVATRHLPSDVIQKAVDDRVADLYASGEIETGDPLSKKHMDHIKHRAIVDLLPQAFIRHRRVYATLVPAQALLIVHDRNKASETFLAYLRKAVGSLPAKAVGDDLASSGVSLTGWLSAAPDFIEVETAFRFDGPLSNASLSSFAADSVLVSELIDSQHKVTKMSVAATLDSDGKFAATIHDDFTLSGLQFSYSKITKSMDAQAAAMSYIVQVNAVFNFYIKLWYLGDSNDN